MAAPPVTIGGAPFAEVRAALAKLGSHGFSRELWADLGGSAKVLHALIGEGHVESDPDEHNQELYRLTLSGAGLAHKSLRRYKPEAIQKVKDKALAACEAMAADVNFEMEVALTHFELRL